MYIYIYTYTQHTHIYISISISIFIYLYLYIDVFIIYPYRNLATAAAAQNARPRSIPWTHTRSKPPIHTGNQTTLFLRNQNAIVSSGMYDVATRKYSLPMIHTFSKGYDPYRTLDPYPKMTRCTYTRPLYCTFSIGLGQRSPM